MSNTKSQNTPKNIFLRPGIKGKLIKIIYKRFCQRKQFSYYDILSDYYGPNIISQNQPISIDKLYNPAKKAMVVMIKYFESKNLPIEKEHINGREIRFQYIGKNYHPLLKEWLEAEYGSIIDLASQTTNEKKTVLKIVYKPFDRGQQEIIFHLHRIVKYNERCFLVGVSEKENCEPMRDYKIALDRIIEFKKQKWRNFIEEIPGEYDYLNDIIGITKGNGKIQQIRIRANDKKTFGRILTKPLHWSQEAVLFPNFLENRSYGEFIINVVPNQELMAKILYFGSNIEIVSPESYRECVINEMQKALEIYKSKPLK